MRIGILNGGGDCPGLNAVIHGVVSASTRMGWEVVGFLDGFEGLLPPGDFMILTPDKTVGIIRMGGTILGTSNKGNFASKVGDSEVTEVSDDVVERARTTIDRLGIGALIVVGGDGTLTTALQLFKKGFPIIGVPKTIDNDISATTTTFGFDSAVSTVVDALDRLRTTAKSHKRIMVLEVMGRHAGWIALYGGIGGAADIVLLPEIPFRFNYINETIKRREMKGLHNQLVVVAEGARTPEGELIAHENEDEKVKKEVRLGGIGQIVANKIHKGTGKDIRICTLGHLQRGGQPTSLDRILGARFGVKAVRLVKDGAFGSMVSYESYKIRSVSIEEAVNQLKLVDPSSEIIKSARYLGISFGDGN